MEMYTTCKALPLFGRSCIYHSEYLKSSKQPICTNKLITVFKTLMTNHTLYDLCAVKLPFRDLVSPPGGGDIKHFPLTSAPTFCSSTSPLTL